MLKDLKRLSLLGSLLSVDEFGELIDALPNSDVLTTNLVLKKDSNLCELGLRRIDGSFWTTQQSSRDFAERKYANFDEARKAFNLLHKDKAKEGYIIDYIQGFEMGADAGIYCSVALKDKKVIRKEFHFKRKKIITALTESEYADDSLSLIAFYETMDEVEQLGWTRKSGLKMVDSDSDIYRLES